MWHMRLVYRGVVLRREGLAGVLATWRDKTLCIDVVEGQCDVFLYTHSHSRHRPQSMPREYISPFGGTVARPGDTLSLGWADVEVVPAYNVIKSRGEYLPHPPGEGVGYVVKIGDVKIYHMGDTDLHPDVYKGDVDILFVPIGGGGVMTPEEAAYAVMSIRPKFAVPIHFENKSDYVKFRDLAYLYTQVVWIK